MKRCRRYLFEGIKFVNESKNSTVMYTTPNENAAISMKQRLYIFSLITIYAV